MFISIYYILYINNCLRQFNIKYISKIKNRNWKERLKIVVGPEGPTPTNGRFPDTNGAKYQDEISSTQ